MKRACILFKYNFRACSLILGYSLHIFRETVLDILRNTAPRFAHWYRHKKAVKNFIIIIGDCKIARRIIRCTTEYPLSILSFINIRLMKNKLPHHRMI